MEKLWRILMEIKTENQELRSMSINAFSAADIKFEDLRRKVGNNK
jgi:hypothetical protein